MTGLPGIETLEKPPTLRATKLKEWIRIHLLSPHLSALPQGEKTLDLACGWGFYFKVNPNAYGIELDDRCVRYLKSRNFKVSGGSILESLPFEPGFFDNCLTHDVLEHFDLKDVEPIFRNIHRVLRKGGIFLNIVPNRKGYDFGVREKVGHKHFITPDELKTIAERTGFTVEKTWSSPLPPPFGEWFTHNKQVVLCRKI